MSAAIPERVRLVMAGYGVNEAEARQIIREFRPMLGRRRSTWPRDAAFAGTQDASRMEQRVYMQYLGVMSLLGRIAGHVNLSREDAALVERAFEDVNVILEVRGSDSYYEKCAPRGYSLFDRPKVTDDAA
jgi:hypothetical protein